MASISTQAFAERIMNFLFMTAAAYPKNLKLPANNECQFHSFCEHQFDYMIRIESSPTCYGRFGKFWCLNGQYHRINGPASIKTRAQYYMQNSIYHRLDGPAKIITGEYVEWWFHGHFLWREYTKHSTYYVQMNTYIIELMMALNAKLPLKYVAYHAFNAECIKTAYDKIHAYAKEQADT